MSPRPRHGGMMSLACWIYSEEGGREGGGIAREGGGKGGRRTMVMSFTGSRPAPPTRCPMSFFT